MVSASNQIRVVAFMCTIVDTSFIFTKTSESFQKKMFIENINLGPFLAIFLPTTWISFTKQSSDGHFEVLNRSISYSHHSSSTGSIRCIGLHFYDRTVHLIEIFGKNSNQVV